MKKLLLLPFLFLSFIGFSQNEIPMQNGSWTECDFILTDSGGLNGNYGNDENFTLTLCPPIAGGTVTLDFLNFSTQINLDILSVYDGDSVNSPLIGAFSGDNTPGGVIIADNVSGCLTLNFVSDGSETTNGWAASVGCLSNFEINQPTDLEVCDFDGSGIATVDLTVKDFEILGTIDPNIYAITYHESFQDAEFGLNALVMPYTNFVNPQTICARVEQLPTGNVEVTCFNILVQPAPIPTALLPVYEICAGSFASIDTGFSEPEFTYAWYLNGIILPSETGPSLITSEVGSYFLEVNSLITGCFTQTEFEVIEVSFDNLTNPTPYVVCDTDDDGISFFNLNTKTDEILGGNQNPNLLVTYHLTQADADGFFNVLDPIFTNTIPFAQTLFVRVSSNTGDCFDITTLDLVVDPDCVAASSVEAFVCGEDPNIPVDYDLTSQESNMLNGQNPIDFTITYYLTEVDAQNETNPLSNPEMYSVSGNSSIVFVRIENQSGSFIVVQIFVNFDLGPNIFLEDTYTICENNFVILTPSVSGSNGYEFLWSTGETDPEIFATAAGEYSVQVTDLGTGCVSEANTIVLEGDIPVVVTPTDIIACTPNAVFDLTTKIPEVLNGMVADNFIISFFRNINDASSNVQAIPNPSTYVSPFQGETIYVRVQNIDNDCFAIVEFDIFIETNCLVVIDCGQPVNTTFCYESSEITQYSFEASDSSTLQVFFNAGQVENNFDALVVLDSDGVTNLNPTETTYGNNGDLTGLSFVSTGNSIRVRIEADDSISCVNQNYTPIDFDVSCVDPNATPGCNITLTQPLDGAIDVNETSDLSWTNASGLVEGYKLSLGLTPGGTEVLDQIDVGNVLTYDLGILDYEITYYVNITPYNGNGDAENCTEYSFTTRANPNQIVICEDGIVNTTYCYENNDDSEFNFQSSDGLPLTLVFNAGGTETNFDEVSILDSDGTVLNPNLPYGNGGDFTGLTYTSTGSSITVRFDSDGTISCATGNGCCTEQFDFDVFCSSSVGIIDVNAFVDDNLNSVFDTNEFSFSNGYFTYEINGDGNINTVNSSTGHFQIISTNDTDVYEIIFNLYDESAGCYDVTIPVFNGISVTEGNTVTVDFPVIEEQSCEDLAVYVINYWTPPRPGFSHDNYLVLENLGFTTISSGTVEYLVDPQLMYNGVTSVNPNYVVTNTANGFTVDFVNLQPGDVEYIDISLTCPVTVQLGEIVTNTATYLTDTNDLVPGNNFSTLSELVVGSWDPNDKMEAHGPRVLFDEFSSSDEWLYYTIRFQNLGTFPATFVRIEDELDSQLDEATFQMLRSSHDYVVTRTDSSLEWFFDDINLPAEQDDPEGSNGFVYFRIKPNAGYALGDIIPNTAAIYFDFNAPVVTNRFETEFVDEALSVSDFALNGFDMYPNPSNDIVNIKLNSVTTAKLSIYDIQGKLVIEQAITDTQLVELNVSDLQSGMYFVKLNTGSKALVKKLIIE